MILLPFRSSEVCLPSALGGRGFFFVTASARRPSENNNNKKGNQNGHR